MMVTQALLSKSQICLNDKSLALIGDIIMEFRPISLVISHFQIVSPDNNLKKKSYFSTF